MNDTVIETHGLSKRFMIGTQERMTLFSSIRYKLNGEFPTREYWALRDINFSVNRGEMVAVIGPNGAGKTTLLRILSGIMRQTQGTFTVTEDVSCVFELGLGFNLRMTAIENLYLYASLHGISRRQINAKLPEIIDFAGLEGFMAAKLGEYSSGMRARLAFATVIQTVQGIVMIDEVLSVGDAVFQRKCLGAIKKILHEGNTVLFIAHGTSEVRDMCSRALYINAGKQVGFGPLGDIEALYSRDVDASLAREKHKSEKHHAVYDDFVQG